MFKTGDAVKSCPAVDSLTGLVIVGSHDGHVYALDPKVGSFKCFVACVLFHVLSCWGNGFKADKNTERINCFLLIVSLKLSGNN